MERNKLYQEETSQVESLVRGKVLASAVARLYGSIPDRVWASSAEWGCLSLVLAPTASPSITSLSLSLVCLGLWDLPEPGKGGKVVWHTELKRELDSKREMKTHFTWICSKPYFHLLQLRSPTASEG